MSKHSAKPNALSFYEKQKATWEEWKQSNGRAPFDWKPPDGGIGAKDFIALLAFLALVTGDKVFSNARQAITDHDLLSCDGNWKRGLVPEIVRAGWERHHDTIFGLAEFAILCGRSKRSAFAEVAAVLRVPAHSFDAAVKQVERLWKERKVAGYTFEQVEDQITSDEMDVAFLRVFSRTLEVLGVNSLQVLGSIAAAEEPANSLSDIRQDPPGELSNHID